MKTIIIKKQKNSNIPDLMTVFNSHPNIEWEASKENNKKDDIDVTFTFFDSVSYHNALKITKLLNNH